MLADYPVVVDYNFSPIQSPLFHHDLTANDDFLIPNHYKEEEVFLGDNESSSEQTHPAVALFAEEDEISVQTSESSISLGGVDNSEIHGGDLEVLVDSSIHGEGVNHSEGQEDGTNFCSHSADLQVLEDDSLHEQIIDNSTEHDKGRNFGSADLAVLEEASISGGEVEHALAAEGLFGCPENDLLDSALLTTLPDGSLHISENVSLSLLDSVDDDLDLCIGSTVEVAEVTGQRSKVAGHRTSSSSSTSSPTRRQQKHKKKKIEDKRWNEMNGAEKTEVADHLSVVLRSLLGPRERLEVLAMITGQERSRLSDTDFVIESHMLNESILAKLETFLEENEMKGEASDSELVVAEPERKRSTLNGKKRKCASLPASPQHEGSFVDRAPVLGRKKSQTQKSTRPWRRRTRKEYRQAAKERRSGLFQQEEVISLSQSIKEDEGEDDIDILE